MLRRINSSTKWTVSSAAALLLLLRHDSATLWCLAGSVASAAACKWLKAVINQQRPARARKADPGMPSSHANALAFLATSAALALLQGPGGDLRRGSVALAVLPLAGAAFLAWLRVALGYHTSEQVAAGAALGCAAAAAWRCLGAAVLPAVRQAPAAEKAAQALGMLALASFGVRTMAQEQGLLKRMYFLGRA